MAKGHIPNNIGAQCTPMNIQSAMIHCYLLDAIDFVLDSENGNTTECLKNWINTYWSTSNSYKLLKVNQMTDIGGRVKEMHCNKNRIRVRNHINL